jgi:hypothetical protein
MSNAFSNMCFFDGFPLACDVLPTPLEIPAILMGRIASLDQFTSTAHRYQFFWRSQNMLIYDLEDSAVSKAFESTQGDIDAMRARKLACRLGEHAMLCQPD